MEGTLEGRVGCLGAFLIILQWLSHETRVSHFNTGRWSSGREWWHTLVILAARRQRQEDCEF